MADDRTYIRVHDGMDEHYKIEGLSDAAFRLLVSLWCYCSRNLNDGRVGDASWRKRGSARSRQELMAAGLAYQRDGYVEMHDYLEHQRSAAEVAELKRKRSLAGAKGGKAKASALASAKQVLKQTASKTVPSTEADTEAEETTYVEGGPHVSSGPAEKAPRFPDHCPEHADDPAPPRCGRCMETRTRRAAAPELLPDYRLRVVPPLCGDCDERWIETPDGWAKCPRCYPQEASA